MLHTNAHRTLVKCSIYCEPLMPTDTYAHKRHTHTDAHTESVSKSEWERIEEEDK